MRPISRLIRHFDFLIDNPQVIRSVIRNYFLKFILGKKVLRTADICFDYSCNYSCRHCYASELADKNRQILDVASIKRAIDLCSQEGAIHFNLIGGEPTLNENIFSMIDYIHKKPALVSLATNGSMLSLKYARLLKQHKLDVILISLDFFDETKQDEFRGVPGYFRKAMEGIENSLKAGLKVFVSKVVMKNEISEESLKSLLAFCKSRNILLHLNLPTLYGRWRDRDDLFFDEEAKKVIRKLYKDNYVRACEMSAYGKIACGSGIEKLHITPYGDVLPCAFIPISFGNIMNEKLLLIRKRMLSFNFFNSYNEMCIPATNLNYNYCFKTCIPASEKFPVKIDDFKKFCQGRQCV
jgi:MoaA/NifB/PqqE/SkfB family radical SAM enzyme